MTAATGLSTLTGTMGDLHAIEGSRTLRHDSFGRLAVPIRKRWLILALTGIAIVGTGIGRREIVNPGGWTLFARFWQSATRPMLTEQYLAQTARAMLTTGSYAVLGTALSLLLGSIGGILLSQRTLSRRVRGDAMSPATRVLRCVLAVPRGIHEAVWALMLLSILGRDPLVAVLAIGLPYGAITAKVYADMLDETALAHHRTLRAAGAGRLQSLLYATLPTTAPDLIGYAFYRFECAVRAAVVLGMVGVGGIGFQLSQSFQGLAYREMWTSLYALLLLGALAEWLSARVRRTTHGACGPIDPARVRTFSQRRGTVRRIALAGGVLTLGAWLHLRPGLSSLWSAQSVQRAGRWVDESFPPKLPLGGWHALGTAVVGTLHVSYLAIIGAAAVALPLALLAARPSHSRRSEGPVRVVIRLLAGWLALVLRSIPPAVWALLALFLLYPGVVPGAVALGIYTAGVLVRLFAETVENADPKPGQMLAAAGAGPLVASLYGTVPTIAPRWVASSLYRWEVAARDAAVVGVVGAGGLGRLLAEQNAGFAFPRIATTILALIAVTILVDTVSSLLRSHLR